MIGRTNAMTITGGAPSQGTLEVKYWDIDGTLLKTQFINPGENATPPANPQYDSELIFTEWNQSSVGLTYPADIGATYSCVNTIIYLMINDNSGYQPSIVMNKLDTSLVTVEWGDGTTSTATVSGNITLLKATPYASAGTYKIRIVSGVDTIRNTANVGFFNNTIYDKWVTKIFFGDNIQSFQNAMIGGTQHTRLEVIAYNTNKDVNLQRLLLQSFGSLKAVIALNKVYSTTTFSHSSGVNVKVVSLPNNGSTFNNVFNGNTSMKRAIFPPLNTYGTSAILTNCTGVEYVYYIGGTVLPNSIFNETPSLLKVDNFDFTTITSIGSSALAGTPLPIDVLDLSNCVDISFSFCNNGNGIKKIILPTTMITTALPNSFLKLMNNVTEVIYPTNAVSTGTFNVNTFPLATKIDCQFIANFGTSNFTGLNSLKTLIFRNTNPPANMFAGTLSLPNFTNIYVPDAQVAAYKALTNLSTYTAQILPLSQLPA